MEGVTSSGSNKHHKAPKGVQYLFITISLLEKLSFPVCLHVGTRSKGLFQVTLNHQIINKPSKLKISKGIVSGIDRNLGEKNLFVPEKHGISHIERIRDELWNITDKVKSYRPNDSRHQRNRPFSRYTKLL